MRSVRNKSIRELLALGPGSPAGSPIAERLAAMLDIPIGRLSDDQLAFCLRQRQASSYLAAIALDRLRDDVWLDAGAYPGHMVIALARNLGRFGHLADLERNVQQIVATASARAEELDEVDRRTFLTALEQLGTRGL